MTASQKWSESGFATLEEAQNAAASFFIRTAAGEFKQVQQSVLAAAIGGAGGSVIAADTVIPYPGTYADWAALIADLKSKTYTGKVTVNVAGNIYTAPFAFPDNFHMRNLHVVFDGAAQLDTTGWAPNLLGLYTVAVLGTNATIGSISGTLTRSAGVQPLLAVAGINFSIGFGTNSGLLPTSGGTMTHMTFDGFDLGLSVIDGEVRGYGKLIMTGVGSGYGFSGAGALLHALDVETDGDTVAVGLNPNIADGHEVGGFRAIAFTGATRQRGIIVMSGSVDLGEVTADNFFINAYVGAEARVKIPGGQTIATGLLCTGSGRIHAALLGSITWMPPSVNSTLTLGEVYFHGAGNTITVDSSVAGDSIINVFDHQRGAIFNAYLAGDYLHRTRRPHNKAVHTANVFDVGAPDTQVETFADAATFVVESYSKRLINDAGPAVTPATMTIDMSRLIEDQEFVLYSGGGVEAMTWVGDGTGGLPGTLAADTWYRFLKANLAWYVI